MPPPRLMKALTSATTVAQNTTVCISRHLSKALVTEIRTSEQSNSTASLVQDFFRLLLCVHLFLPGLRAALAVQERQGRVHHLRRKSHLVVRHIRQDRQAVL